MFLQSLDHIVIIVMNRICERLFIVQPPLSTSTKTKFKKKKKTKILKIKIKKKQCHLRSHTELPQRSLVSTLAPRSRRSWTTSLRPWQAATWRAVRSSMSRKLTSIPESRSSLIPSKSPSLAEYISLTPGSTSTSSSSSVGSGAGACSEPRSGAIDDCFPRVNRNSVVFVASIFRQIEKKRERLKKKGKMKINN